MKKSREYVKELNPKEKTEPGNLTFTKTPE